MECPLSREGSLFKKKIPGALIVKPHGLLLYNRTITTSGSKDMQRLKPIDSTFLWMDTKRTPMHIGGLLTFRLPEGASSDFFREVMDLFRSDSFMPSQFNYRLARGWMSGFLPAWEKAEPDFEYHIRHSALPKPGGERELGILVARLHSHPLDLNRPPWELHLIEGLERGRFALYFKAHHCAIDGAGAMRMVTEWLSTNPDDPGSGRIFNPSTGKAGTGPLTQLGKLVSSTGKQVGSSGELARKLVTMSRDEQSMVRSCLRTPRSIFNRRIGQQRRLGTQLLELSRFKAIAARRQTTVNDVVLAVCGGAARAYLMEQASLPKRTLTASVPMALENSGKGDAGGNALAGFVCPLGTDEPDPLQRLAQISKATQYTKEDMQTLSRTALDELALAGLAPMVVGQMTGTSAQMPPMFNFVVSNVVLSRKKLYLMGAELEAMYPMSFLFDSYALNVTVIGYAEHVAIGFIGCRDTVPRLQTLAVYAGKALDELEQAASVRKAQGRKRPSTRARSAR